MLTITIDVRDARWKKSLRSYRKMVTDACNAAYKTQSRAKKELAVVLADDAFVKELNHTYRGKDKPTNILSFDGEGDSLGDVVLAFERVAKEAADQGKTLKDHTLHLLVHGVLHLCGYDHEKDKDAAKMEAQEIKILKKLEVGNPYL